MNKEKRKVLVANLRPLGEVFNITPKVFAAGGKQYSQLADRLEVTYDYDLEKYNSLIGETEILVGWEFPRYEIKEVAPKLRWIHLMGSGLDQCLPLDWLPENVLLTTSAGAHAVKAGEFMATALMMLNNNVLQFITNQNRQHFQSIYSSPIAGKTVVLVGVGGIGGAAADRCQALGMHVIGVRPSNKCHASIDETFGVEHLNDVLPRADFVLISAPLTRDTRGMFGSEELSNMKQGAGLVNFGRHSIVNEDALIDALETGHLGGAIMDVENPDQVEWNPRLWATPNLLIIPHCVTNDPPNFPKHIIEVFFRNLDGYLRDETMATQVGREREY